VTRSAPRRAGERNSRARALIEQETVPLIQGAAMNLLTVDRLRELYALEANLGLRAAAR
jgi:hypothetical protein